MRDDLFKLPQDLVTIEKRFFMIHMATSNAIILAYNTGSSHVRAQRLQPQLQLEA